MLDLPKNILKTIHYADLFDYPLRLIEVRRYLISKSPVSPEDISAALQNLVEGGRIVQEEDLYFLPGRSQLVSTRWEREANTKVKIGRVTPAIRLIGFCPWVKLVGLTGALAVGNGDKKSDVDLLIVTSGGRLWLTRFLVFVFLNLTNLKRNDRQKDSSGKVCANLWLDEENLSVGESDRDLVVAHEIAQMKPLVNKNNMYEKFVTQNLWLKNFLPNWKP